jgi:Periplasmic binding protein
LNKSEKPRNNWDAPVARADAVRIVSLVPSLTELVCELGLGKQLVGRTGFCIHPASELVDVPKLGGTKQVNEKELLALRPTHLIVNKDENELPLVERLKTQIPHLLITHPIQVEDNFILFRQFSESFGSIPGVTSAAEKLAQELRSALNENQSRMAHWKSETVLYLIWKKPWMSIATNTYIASMLRTVAWQSYSPTHHSQQDLAEVGASRYPSLSHDEVLGSGADRILLSSEPYRFQARHISDLAAELPTKSSTSIHLIDGEMCSWYGPRAIQGLKYLLQLRQSLQ